jgi:hypothetical protein
MLTERLGQSMSIKSEIQNGEGKKLEFKEQMIENKQYKNTVRDWNASGKTSASTKNFVSITILIIGLYAGAKFAINGYSRVYSFPEQRGFFMRRRGGLPAAV